MVEISNKKSVRLGQITYPFRVMGYYFGIAILIVNYGGFPFLSPFLIGFISFSFIYPHIGFAAFKFSGNNTNVEYFNLTVDAILLGGFINLMEFAFVPGVVFGAMIISSHAAIEGFRRVLFTIIFIIIGVLAMGLFNGFGVEIVSSSPVVIISTLAISLFSIVYSYLGYLRSASLKKARHDIKFQKEELERKKDQLGKMNKEKDYLIGIAAHDLKSPLNQIIALVQIIELSSGNLNKKQHENFNYIARSATRMREMISKILDIHAIEAGEFNFSYQVFDLRDAALDMVENFKKDAEFKNIRLVTQITDKPCIVHLDKSYLMQIVENLLSNAIKFTEPDKKVTVIVKTIGEKVSLVVKDEGPGISLEDQKMLFNKFQKLSARPTGNEPSSGLGLAIVKKYTDAMNGSVWCESELGKGSLFCLEFHMATLEEIKKKTPLKKNNLPS